MDLDDVSAAFVGKYQAKYGDERPVFPHFNGFNAYHGVKNAFAAAEQAGGFAPLDDWVREMENTDVKLYKGRRVLAPIRVLEAGRDRAPNPARVHAQHQVRHRPRPYDDGRSLDGG